MEHTGSNGFDLTAAGLAVGDVVGAAAGPAAIFRPGPARWYALRVAPQREDQAEAWLRRRGVYGFHPVLLRRVRRQGVLREYQRRYLPGYVFARFPGEPVVHAVIASPFIIGALTLASGVWGILDPRRMGQIHAMRNVDAEAEAIRKAKAAQRRAAAMVRPGDAALFTGGAFVGQQCEVVDLAADGGATVRMRLFGGDVLVAAQASALVGLRKPC